MTTFDPPPPRSQPTPPFQERFFQYTLQMLASIIFHILKHNCFLFENKYDLNHLIQTTTREVERIFGQVKWLVERNINLRTIIIQSIVTLRGQSLEEIYLSNKKYSEKYSLFSKGRYELESYPTRGQWANQKMMDWERQCKTSPRSTVVSKEIDQALLKRLLSEEGIPSKPTYKNLLSLARKKGLSLPKKLTKSSLLNALRNLMNQKLNQVLSCGQSFPLLEFQ